MVDDEAEGGYTAAELAARAGVSERTVRYYVREGLLPAPAGRGRGAHFGPGHLIRLKLIREIQKAGNNIRTIREYLDELGPDDGKAEAALRVWETRQEQAAWSEIWRERFGAPSSVFRYRIAEGIELLVDARSAPSPTRMAAALRAVRKAFDDESGDDDPGDDDPGDED
jgi:DNA-binding transcriptional MerR regulator